MNTLIAIDPGQKGGIAVLSLAGLHTCPMPDTDGDIRDILECESISARVEGLLPVAYIEAQAGYVGPKSAGAISKFMRHYGYLQGVLDTLKIRRVEVRPQVWQAALGLGRRGKMDTREWKNKLKAVAQRLYPQLVVTLETADALLMLEYACAQNRIPSHD